MACGTASTRLAQNEAKRVFSHQPASCFAIERSEFREVYFVCQEQRLYRRPATSFWGERLLTVQSNLGRLTPEFALGRRRHRDPCRVGGPMLQTTVAWTPRLFLHQPGKTCHMCSVFCPKIRTSESKHLSLALGTSKAGRLSSALGLCWPWGPCLPQGSQRP